MDGNAVNDLQSQEVGSFRFTRRESIEFLWGGHGGLMQRIFFFISYKPLVKKYTLKAKSTYTH